MKAKWISLFWIRLLLALALLPWLLQADTTNSGAHVEVSWAAVTNGVTSYPVRLPGTVQCVLVTNVFSGDNSSGCNLCYNEGGVWRGGIPATWPPADCKPFHRATEKWTVSNIVQRITLQVKWEGDDLSHVREKLLVGVTNRWTLTTEWIEVRADLAPPGSPKIHVIGNPPSEIGSLPENRITKTNAP